MYHFPYTCSAVVDAAIAPRIAPVRSSAHPCPASQQTCTLDQCRSMPGPWDTSMAAAPPMAVLALMGCNCSGLKNRELAAVVTMVHFLVPPRLRGRQTFTHHTALRHTPRRMHQALAWIATRKVRDYIHCCTAFPVTLFLDVAVVCRVH